MNDWKQYKVDVPQGKSGAWSVEKFAVSAEDEKLERLRAMISFSIRGRFVPAGIYTALKRHGEIIMSDTPDEIRDHYQAIRMAHGKVLINGLGLGVYLQAVLNKPEVEHVTVVELSDDVLKLVAPHYQSKYGDKLTIIHADALDYKSPKGIRYGAVWHDIWDNLCADNFPQMAKLHRRYGRITDWQGSWGKEQITRYR